MAIDKIRTSYKNLVNKWSTPPPDERSAEETLDALLDIDERRQSEDAASPSALGRPTPLDIFRRKFREELIPVFEEIRGKYGPKGIRLSLDASDFLRGGRRLAIEFSVHSHSIRLDGTVMESGIAFNEIRSIGGVAGAICSGPMLRTRQLTSDEFREFICVRIALLVRSLLRQKR